MERHLAYDLASALTVAIAARPDLVALDRDLPGAERLVAYVRSAPRLAAAAVAIISRGYRPTIEAALLEAGADAILRLPVTAAWNARLSRLVLASALFGH